MSINIISKCVLLLLNFSWSSDSIVRVGDKLMNLSDWAKFRDRLSCWTSNSGFWRKNPKREQLIDHIYSNDQGLNTKVYSACGPKAKRIGLDYFWEPPAHCDIIPQFTRSGLCQIMRGRTLIFLGDSLSVHMYETLINAMGNRTNYGRGRCDSDNPTICISSHPYYCNQYFNFSIVMLRVPNISWFSRFKRELSDIYNTTGAVVVANWGAVYQPNDTVASKAQEILEWFDNNLPRALFIFRSSNMAHENCYFYREPDNVMHIPVNHPRHKSWHWADFPKQNVIWEDLIAQRFPGKVYMDIFPMSAKRPDQHTSYSDCLHYCIPGPVDEWVRLLYAILAEIESKSLPDTIL